MSFPPRFYRNNIGFYSEGRESILIFPNNNITRFRMKTKHQRLLGKGNYEREYESKL